MGSTTADDFEILLLADDAKRITMLRRSFRDNGLTCRINRLGLGKKAADFLHRQPPERPEMLRKLVLFDFAEASPQTLDLARDVAVGQDRSPCPVVLMTSPDTESMLEAGELDDGEATMFKARTLDTFLQKLVGGRRQNFLEALLTLYQYGPILARLPDEIVETVEQHEQLSA